MGCINSYCAQQLLQLGSPSDLVSLGYQHLRAVLPHLPRHSVRAVYTELQAMYRPTSVIKFASLPPSNLQPAHEPLRQTTVGVLASPS